MGLRIKGLFLDLIQVEVWSAMWMQTLLVVGIKEMLMMLTL